jgi:hypothetical protein
MGEITHLIEGGERMLIEFCNTDGAVLSERQLHLDENEHLE